MRRAANGDGNLRKRSDGRWSGRFYTNIDGRRVRREVYGHTQAEARRNLRAAIAATERGLLPENPTVKQWLERWIESKDGAVRFTTSHRYRQLVERHLIPSLGSVYLKKLTLVEVNRMLQSKSVAGLSGRTVHHIRAVLRNALNDAVASGLVDRNVAHLRVFLPPLAPKRRNWLEPSEADALLRAASGDRLEALLAVLSLGLRPSEALGLRWRDVLLEAKPPTLTVQHALHRRTGGGLVLTDTKSRESRRTLIVPKFASEALLRHHALQAGERLAAKDWLGTTEGDFVFTTPLGTPLDPAAFRRTVYRFLDLAGLKGRITPYGLRHTAASILYAQTHDIQLVAKILGHTSAELALRTYVHAVGEPERVAADALDRAFGTASYALR